MYPAYHNFQFTVLDKQPGEIGAGDVVAFRCDGLKAVLVKRVAAVPGDRVQIQAGTLQVNGQVSSIYPEEGCFAYAGILEDPVELGQGEYILIGDNLEKSKDSRYEAVGIVNRKDITGKIIK